MAKQLNQHPNSNNQKKTLPDTPEVITREQKKAEEVIKKALTRIRQSGMELEGTRREYFRELAKLGHLKKPKKGRGDYRTKWDSKFVILSKAFAALGLPDDNIAALLGVHSITFSKWKLSHRELARATREGEALRNTNLIENMVKGVKDGIFTTQIFLAKNWLGMVDKVDTKHSGEIGITYRSNIPGEKGKADVDPSSVKKKPGKRRE